jgi:hypothetical protein
VTDEIKETPIPTGVSQRRLYLLWRQSEVYERETIGGCHHGSERPASTALLPEL